MQRKKQRNDPVQCTAKSKRSGEQCRNHAVKGKTKCRIHGGANDGPPKGNKNALKHGAYEAISPETMTEEEIAYANAVTLNPCETLREQLKTLRVKEARIAKRLK
ncbi:MAG: HGGxSTG domain-containing protein, partial [Bilophila wadsworthia]